GGTLSDRQNADTLARGGGRECYAYLAACVASERAAAIVRGRQKVAARADRADLQGGTLTVAELYALRPAGRAHALRCERDRVGCGRHRLGRIGSDAGQRDRL